MTAEQRSSTTRLRTAGLIVHPGRPEARRAATDAAERLASSGVTVIGCRDDEWQHEAVRLRPAERFAEGLDVVIVMGGDGTFLRAAFLTRDRKVPLAGVNLGRLGFLSEIEAADLPTAVDELLAGAYEIEERMTLAVDVRGPDGAVMASSWALNEASVERTVPQRLIILEVRVGETIFANVPADALICATPTGSTAYAFSAGGPILSHLVDAILLVPVAPHSLFDRTLVVDPHETLTVSPVGGDNTCVVSLDGRTALEVPTGGSVEITQGSVPLRLARLKPFDFYARVREKFRLE
ncbi:MAG: NAD(+)/NADH kinase [Egibacteraceae bacterium]